FQIRVVAGIVEWQHRQRARPRGSVPAEVKITSGGDRYQQHRSGQGESASMPADFLNDVLGAGKMFERLGGERYPFGRSRLSRHSVFVGRRGWNLIQHGWSLHESFDLEFPFEF